MKAFEFRNRVDDVQEVTTHGPWDTKSGGTLEVLFALNREYLTRFLNFDNPEFDEVERMSGIDIRGLRSYTVKNIANGSIGAREWHRARTEYVRATSGVAMWTCVDFEGNKKQILLNGSNSVITPPGILHTYQALEDDTSLQVICNTLFVPEDPLTHDSFMDDTFYAATKH